GLTVDSALWASLQFSDWRQSTPSHRILRNALRGDLKKMAAIGEGGHTNRALCVAYIFIGVAWLATHCHLPVVIFIHVSVHRSLLSKGFPLASVPLPLKPPVAMAVSPNTVTFTSSYSALSHFVFL